MGCLSGKRPTATAAAGQTAPELLAVSGTDASKQAAFFFQVPSSTPVRNESHHTHQAYNQPALVNNKFAPESYPSLPAFLYEPLPKADLTKVSLLSTCEPQPKDLPIPRLLPYMPMTMQQTIGATYMITKPNSCTASNAYSRYTPPSNVTCANVGHSASVSIHSQSQFTSSLLPVKLQQQQQRFDKSAHLRDENNNDVSEPAASYFCHGQTWANVTQPSEILHANLASETLQQHTPSCNQPTIYSKGSHFYSQNYHPTPETPCDATLQQPFSTRLQLGYREPWFSINQPNIRPCTRIAETLPTWMTLSGYVSDTANVPQRLSLTNANAQSATTLLYEFPATYGINNRSVIQQSEMVTGDSNLSTPYRWDISSTINVLPTIEEKRLNGTPRYAGTELTNIEGKPTFSDISAFEPTGTRDEHVGPMQSRSWTVTGVSSHSNTAALHEQFGLQTYRNFTAGSSYETGINGSQM